MANECQRITVCCQEIIRDQPQPKLANTHACKHTHTQVKEKKAVTLLYFYYVNTKVAIAQDEELIIPFCYWCIHVYMGQVIVSNISPSDCVNQKPQTPLRLWNKSRHVSRSFWCVLVCFCWHPRTNALEAHDAQCSGECSMSCDSVLKQIIQEGFHTADSKTGFSLLLPLSSSLGRNRFTFSSSWSRRSDLGKGFV